MVCGKVDVTAFAAFYHQCRLLGGRKLSNGRGFYRTFASTEPSREGEPGMQGQLSNDTVWQTRHNQNQTKCGVILSLVDRGTVAVCIDHHDRATQPNPESRCTTSSMAFSHRSWWTLLVSVTDTRWPRCHRGRGLMVANFDTDVTRHD